MIGEDEASPAEIELAQDTIGLCYGAFVITIFFIIVVTLWLYLTSGNPDTHEYGFFLERP